MLEDPGTFIPSCVSRSASLFLVSYIPAGCKSRETALFEETQNGMKVSGSSSIHLLWRSVALSRCVCSLISDFSIRTSDVCRDQTTTEIWSNNKNLVSSYKVCMFRFLTVLPLVRPSNLAPLVSRCTTNGHVLRITVTSSFSLRCTYARRSRHLHPILRLSLCLTISRLLHPGRM